MQESLEGLYGLLRFIRPFETAVAACVLLTLAVAYVQISKVQRSNRALLTVTTTVSLIFTIITATKINEYYTAVDTYQPLPKLSEGAIVMAPFVLLVVLHLCAIVLTRAWPMYTRAQRATLALGGATLTATCTNVAAGCISYVQRYDSSAYTFFSNLKIVSRDAAVFMCVAFILAAIVVACQAFRRRQLRRQMLNSDQGCEPRDGLLIKRSDRG